MRGIRGPAYTAGRRHFYVTQGGIRGSRCGPVYSVSPAFFPDVVNECRRLVDHLADEPLHHLHEQAQAGFIPHWMVPLTRRLPASFGAMKAGRDTAVMVCAELLDVSPRTIYARMRDAEGWIDYWSRPARLRELEAWSRRPRGGPRPIALHVQPQPDGPLAPARECGCRSGLYLCTAHTELEAAPTSRT